MRQSIPTLNQPVAAHLTLPGSKSITNRALLLAGMANGVSLLEDILLSDDTRVFLNALTELGVEIQLDEKAATCQIKGKGHFNPAKAANIFCREAGTAARFLLAACAASEGTFQFDAADQLRRRPLSPLLTSLRAQGATISADSMPFTVTAKNNLTGGEIYLPGDQSSQFISAMLMAAPLCKTAVTIKTKELVSTPYVAMTCRMMADFGINVLPGLGQYQILAPQQYLARNYKIEPDLSTASYFFAAAAVTAGEFSMQYIAPTTSLQADSAFLTVLNQMGCEIKTTTNKLTVQGPKQLSGVTIDMKDFSDTFMTLAAIACFATTPTLIKNIAHTRLQESDRIMAMYTNLQILGIKVESGSDWLKVYPSTPHSATVNSFNDHRIAMSLALIGLKVPGIEIENAQCVSKTCPEFFNLWTKLTTTKEEKPLVIV